VVVRADETIIYIIYVFLPCLYNLYVFITYFSTIMMTVFFLFSKLKVIRKCFCSLNLV